VAKGKPITATLKQERETKGTFLFGSDTGPIRSAYFNKSAFEGDVPETIKVTVEPA
jgi:hypothetical protein